ncbi:hypothetical protein MXD62_20135 [Frankia sp. Mgl5]|uniref:hypothetical protein n=1 Tax=Frankia sp. Mgl5 TaxID=2933793 RepID=UPI00201079B4|nr:hypothetical protein [Frankia sp. Mgl5]MCK9929460.1 hypothetical protein [Frankia sp. Mgl5]
MARIRTIKPDAFASDSLSQVPVRARWTFAGIWTYADDDGRCRADARLIKAHVYPLDDDITARDVAADLDALEHVGCIRRYEVAAKLYLHLPGWADHQKISHPTKSKIPAPPESSGNPPEPSGRLSGPGNAPVEAAGRFSETSGASADVLDAQTAQSRDGITAESGDTGITAGQATSPESSGNPPENLRSLPETLRPEVEVEVEREREEGREEDLKAGGTHSAPPRSGGPKRGTRLPEDWEPDRGLKQWTLDQGMTPEQARRTVEDFRDFWCSKTGRDATKTGDVGWARTWKRWVREEIRRGQRTRSNVRPLTRAQQSDQILDAAEARLNGATEPDQSSIFPFTVIDGEVIHGETA